jgi:hypothetical protein
VVVEHRFAQFAGGADLIAAGRPVAIAARLDRVLFAEIDLRPPRAAQRFRNLSRRALTLVLSEIERQVAARIEALQDERPEG